MTICNVLSILPIEENTAIVVDTPRKIFRNGIGILDENGKPYEVLSVGMERIGDYDCENVLNKTSLLIAGSFSSKKIYVWFIKILKTRGADWNY